MNVKKVIAFTLAAIMLLMLVSCDMLLFDDDLSSLTEEPNRKDKHGLVGHRGSINNSVIDVWNDCVLESEEAAIESGGNDMLYGEDTYDSETLYVDPGDMETELPIATVVYGIDEYRRYLNSALLPEKYVTYDAFAELGELVSYTLMMRDHNWVTEYVVTDSGRFTFRIQVFTHMTPNEISELEEPNYFHTYTGSGAGDMDTEIVSWSEPMVICEYPCYPEDWWESISVDTAETEKIMVDADADEFYDAEIEADGDTEMVTEAHETEEEESEECVWYTEEQTFDDGRPIWYHSEGRVGNLSERYDLAGQILLYNSVYYSYDNDGLLEYITYETNLYTADEMRVEIICTDSPDGVGFIEYSQKNENALMRILRGEGWGIELERYMIH